MLDELKTFIKCCECGSFSAAGKTLLLSPSSVSRQIDSLETKLQTKLFQRTTRQLILSDEGRFLLERAEDILARLDDTVASLRQLHGEPEGRLRISVLETYGRLHISPLLPKFLALYPKVSVDIELENQMVDLYRDAVDIAIRIGPPEDSRLKAKKLTDGRMLLCASPDYVASFGPPQAPEDLARHNCLLISRGRRQVWWRFHKGQEHRRVQVQGSLRSAGGTPLLESALQGVGITLLTQWSLQPYIDEGRLLPLLPQWRASLYPENGGEIYAAYIDNHYMRPAIRAFLDFLGAHFVQ
ncbi:Transcriptional regulator [Hahella chejuensis KCTC 2396]|uniref:Transcriptional regulator n=1 Tax=Hahella chejuensis (strain KCTC 2396) TaxID=349521 RepID=Q2SLG9_HAHCH|nr:LysR family transcriptional regulator [Hahella chejuensis]ABC28505.1 Transcriptional regulator [Hahella chejuensis KCTC 2396]